MMMKKSILAIFLTTSLSIFSQSKHTISIQSGLVHSYFDNTPLVNLNYTSKDQGIFHGVFLGSNGLSYAFALNNKSSITFEGTRLARTYEKYRNDYQMGDLERRVLSTFCIKYNRNFLLTEKTKFIYGAGVSYRKGFEDIHLGPAPWPFNSSVVQYNIGLTTVAGIQYPLNNSFSIYSLIDLRTTLVNLDNNFQNPRMYNGYPNRFDLSLKLGLSFHF